jgi:hypothetical protein
MLLDQASIKERLRCNLMNMLNSKLENSDRIVGNEPLRPRVIVVFDTYYSNRENIVASYVNHILDQLDFCKDFQIVTRNAYKGAKIKRPGLKIVHFSEIDRSRIGKSVGRHLKGLLSKLALASENEKRWHSDISPYRVAL